MMDYCAKESTLVENYDCQPELSTSEILKIVTKELRDTTVVLSNIMLFLDGENMNERKTDEPKCLHDEAKLIEHLAADCMGLSHMIHARLFGNYIDGT